MKKKLNMNDKINELSINQILYYNPHDHRYRYSRKGFRLNDFYNHFFVELEEYGKNYESLKTILNPDKGFEKKYIILSSYSGNGKSTFIHWFRKNIHRENYFFLIINLINNAKGNRSGSIIIESVIKNYLEKLLKKSYAIPFFVFHEEIFYGYQLFREMVDNKLSITVWDKIREIKDSIDSKNFSYIAVQDFLRSLSLSHLLFIFFFEYILRFQSIAKLKDKKSYTFCFDNLDELDFEYLTSQMWNEFYMVFEDIQYYCEKTKVLFDIDKIKLMLIFREANIGIASAQYNDRLTPQLYEKKILLTKNAHKVFERRHEIIQARKSGLRNAAMHNFLEIINKTEENYTSSFLLPLFNFDHRKLFLTFIKLIQENEGTTDNKAFIDISKDEYNKISSLSKNGSRGILVNALIKYFWGAHFLTRFIREPKEDYRTKYCGYCRSSRMILTAISNLAYPTGFPRNTIDLHQKSPKAIYLTSLYKNIRDVFPANKLLYWLKEFFSPSEASWTHFISIHNKSLSHDNVIDFSEEEKLLKDEKYDDDRIKDIKVYFNASAYIYLRLLIPHFEFFSVFEARKSRNPLFQSVRFQDKKGKYDFEYIIEDVFNIVKKFKNNNNNYLKEVLMNKHDYTIEDYSRSLFTFRKTDEDRKKLFISRVITTHIEYIDAFRFFLFHDKSFKIKNSENNGKYLNAKTDSQIQWDLIGWIEKYIKLGKESIKVNYMDEIYKDLEGKVNIIKMRNRNSSSDLPFYYDKNKQKWIWIAIN